MTCRTLVVVACALGFALSLSPAAFAQTEGGGTGGKYKRKTDTPAEPSSTGQRDGEGRTKPKGDAPHEPPVESDNATGDPGILAGPEVEQEAESGPNNPMSSPNAPVRRRAADQAVPFRQWMETLRGLGLSEEQQRHIAAIASEFQVAQREFQQAHAEEMQSLQRRMRIARESGKEPDQALREELQKLEAEMPQQIDVQRRIWEELTPEQQATARTRLAALQKRMQEQRRPNAGGAGTAGSTGAAQGPRTGNSQDAPSQPGSEGGGDQMLSPSGNGDRAQPKSTTTGADDQMTGGARPETAMEPVQASPARDRSGARERRRGEAGGIDMEGLDSAARSRVQFLMQRLSAARPGNEPAAAEKTFRFVEDQ